MVYHFGSNLMQYYYIIHPIGYLFLSNIMQVLFEIPKK